MKTSYNYIFVTKEIALKLKEEGFDDPCGAHFRKKDDALIAISGGIAGVCYSWIEDTDVILTPTFDQVIEWLIETKNINIWVDCSGRNEWVWAINNIDKGDYTQSQDIGACYYTRREALIEGILFYLNGEK